MDRVRVRLAVWGVALSISTTWGCAAATRDAAPLRDPWTMAAARAGAGDVFDPLTLDEVTRENLRQEIGERGDALARFRRVVDALKHGGRSFVYAPDATYSARLAWETRRGDCFAFANAVVAAARVLGVPAHFVYVRELVSFEERGGSLLSSSHVAAAFGDGASIEVAELDTRSSRLVNVYHPIDDGAARALFHMNRAMDSLRAGKLSEAETLLRFLNEQRPDLPELSNNLGVALLRKGDGKAALAVLKPALERFADFTPLYTNGVLAAVAAGDDALAYRYAAERDRASERDPFLQVARGIRHLRRSEWDEAVKRFTRAAEIAPQTATPWLWLTRAYLALGELAKARTSLERAAALAPDDERVRQLRERNPSLG